MSVSTVLYMYTEILDLQVCVYCTVHVHRDIRPICLCVYCTVHVRGVAGSKTMCNQRTSARGLGDA
jgi:hypothetical protein